MITSSSGHPSQLFGSAISTCFPNLDIRDCALPKFSLSRICGAMSNVSRSSRNAGYAEDGAYGKSLYQPHRRQLTNLTEADKELFTPTPYTTWSSGTISNSVLRACGDVDSATS
jgi:hypothetical protein